jgi:3-hydroxyacyl-CoA dehydrogenase
VCYGIGADRPPEDDEGLVTPKDIDDSVTRGIALRMPILGLMAKADFTGLPVVSKIRIDALMPAGGSILWTSRPQLAR